MTSVEAPVGAKVQVTAGIGHVRWTGSNPGFAAGKWVGVELLEAAGKNDGSVKGERYFDCPASHGVFVRPSQVKILEMPVASRPSTGMRPPSTPSTSRTGPSTPSRQASPTKTRPGGAGAATPLRTVSNASNPSQASTSRRPSIAPPSRAASGSGPAQIPAPSTSMPPPAAIPRTIPRPSSAASASSVSSVRRPPSVAESSRVARPPSVASTAIDEEPNAALPPASRQSISPTRSIPANRRVSSPSKSQEIPSTTATRTLPSLRSLSATMSTATKTDSHALGTNRASKEADASSPAASVAPLPPVEQPDRSEEMQAAKRELEELRIKVRQLEQRKTEDQERIKGLESKAVELDTMRTARVKLQAKFQEIQSSLLSAQRQAKDYASENTHLETRATDAMEQLEMAALDREMAEEKAEAAEGEVEKLNEKVAELELEVALLKEENAEYERPIDAQDGEKTSAAYIQLEKHNERLKEALIRLRDMSTENEREFKSRISDMEKDLSSQDDLTGQLELAEAKLAHAEAQVEELKLQLDDALGAEDMLEQLTERNLQMSERIEEMRVTIEDLEALKELNDELEENHVETERQLNAELDKLGAQLREERDRAEELDSVVLDMDNTIGQFRDLVQALQSEIDDLRDQHQDVQKETAATSKEAQALLNLNMKLQTSASKAQNRTIDLELTKIEAGELKRHLDIALAYLPDAFQETDQPPTMLYLFFVRVSSKIDLLSSVIGTMHSLPASLSRVESSELVGACELRGKLRHFSALNKRFGATMARCSPDEWVESGSKILPEVQGVEGRVDAWMAMLREERFSELECATELANLINQFNHLASTSFARSDGLDMPEQQLGHAYNVDCDLDNFAAAVGFARQAVLGLAEIDIDVGESSLEEGVYEPVQRLLDLVKSIKGPAVNLVGEAERLAKAGQILPEEVLGMLATLAGSVTDAVDLAVQLAQRIGAHAADLRASKEVLRLSDIETFLDEVVAQSSAPADMHPWDIIASFITRLGTQISTCLSSIRTASSSSSCISVPSTTPWSARVSSLRATTQQNSDTERKLLLFTEDNKTLQREVKLRDQSLQEAGVKVETLEKRLEGSRKMADVIVELENDVAKAKKQEKVYEDAIEQVQKELEEVERELAALKKDGGRAVQNHANQNGHGSFETATVSSLPVEAGHLAEQVSVKLDIALALESLRAALRHLRHENALLRSKHLYSTLHALPALGYRAPSDAVASLDNTAEDVPDLDVSAPDSPSSDTSSLPPLTPTIHGHRSKTQRPTRQALETESKLLFREMARMSAVPKIVDLCKVPGYSRSNVGADGAGREQAMLGVEGVESKHEGRVEGDKAQEKRVQRERPGWTSRKKRPEVQIWEWQKGQRELEKRVEGLKERVRLYSMA